MTMWVWRLDSQTNSLYSNANALNNAIQYINNQNNPFNIIYQNNVNNFALVAPGHTRTWQTNELFLHNQLRQGWCGPGLALNMNLPRNQWITNGQLIFNSNYQQTVRRYNILREMLYMHPGDTIFLPKVDDDDHFTVVTISDTYHCEDRSGHNIFWMQDFGHIIPVDGQWTKKFRYGIGTLMANVFRTPFIACIVKIPSSSYRGIDNFLIGHRYPFNPY